MRQQQWELCSKCSAFNPVVLHYWFYCPLHRAFKVRLCYFCWVTSHRNTVFLWQRWQLSSNRLLVSYPIYTHYNKHHLPPLRKKSVLCSSSTECYSCLASQFAFFFGLLTLCRSYSSLFTCKRSVLWVVVAFLHFSNSKSEVTVSLYCISDSLCSILIKSQR